MSKYRMEKEIENWVSNAIANLGMDGLEIDSYYDILADKAPISKIHVLSCNVASVGLKEGKLLKKELESSYPSELEKIYPFMNIQQGEDIVFVSLFDKDLTSDYYKAFSPKEWFGKMREVGMDNAFEKFGYSFDEVESNFIKTIGNNYEFTFENFILNLVEYFIDEKLSTKLLVLGKKNFN